jgi:NTE family protein/lysophospholipid hydrolase
MRECGEALRDVLSRRGSVALITAQTCLAAGFGSYKGEIEDDGHGNFDLLDWLGNQESDNFCVIYVADDENSIWTQICLGHADQLFIVINGGDEPMLGTLEQQIHQDPRLADLPSTALFLQPQDIKIPSNTARHLALRQCKDHFHLRRSQRDWERIGRFLTGHAVGLVLGGGGARGFSHLGVIRALEEIGVPIDMVGGTSVGALISSLYAFGMSHQEILQHMMDMVHRSEQITLPLVSLMSGKRFSRGIKDLLGTSMIEDMWRTFFCISCNLSRAATVVHSKGSARQAVLASNSPPGLLPPVVVNRELHVDGALLNGLPLDVMGNLNKGGLLIVVDVQPREELFSDASTEDGLSGWRVLRERLFPKKNQARDPGIVEILSRSMAIGGLANRERLLKRATDLLLTPPTAQYAITDHKLGFEIADVGYQDTHKRVLSWWENQPKL